MNRVTEYFHINSFVKASPMNRGEYNEYRGWSLPADEKPDDTGYLVEDPSGVANHPDHQGYIRWLPTEEFTRHAKLLGTMDFSDAILALKAGLKVARMGWNGKGMFLFLVPGSTFTVNRPPLLGIYPEGTTINYRPHIDMKTADGDVVPWVASQSDILSDDWLVVD